MHSGSRPLCSFVTGFIVFLFLPGVTLASGWQKEVLFLIDTEKTAKTQETRLSTFRQRHRKRNGCGVSVCQGLQLNAAAQGATPERILCGVTDAPALS